MSITFVDNNPFHANNVNTICVLCYKKLEKNCKSHTIFEVITNTPVEMRAIEALFLISNFNQIGIDKVPHNVCAACFQNLSAAFKFYNLCNTSVENIKAYLKTKPTMKLEEEEEEKEGNDFYKDNDDDKLDMQEFIITKPVEDIAETSKHHDSYKDSKDILGDGLDLEQEMNETDTWNVHSESQIEIEKVNKSTVAQCNICKKWFNKGYMAEHVRIHTGERPFVCEICSKGHNSLYNLQIHIRSHDDEKPFLCKICGQSYKLSCTLARHEKMHFNTTVLQCEFCEKQFKNNDSLGKHLRTHTNDRRYTCKLCDKRFKTSSHMKRHLLTHSDCKPFSCYICQKQFTRACTMRIHLKSHGDVLTE